MLLAAMQEIEVLIACFCTLIHPTKRCMKGTHRRDVVISWAVHLALHALKAPSSKRTLIKRLGKPARRDRRSADFPGGQKGDLHHRGGIRSRWRAQMLCQRDGRTARSSPWFRISKMGLTRTALHSLLTLLGNDDRAMSSPLSPPLARDGLPIDVLIPER
jgi:hypothetical protein